jgi:D-proline reductase (dithiol) PrdB
MHDNDQSMKTYVATLPVPAFEKPAFNRPPALRDARVAIVTSAALTRKGGLGKWTLDDTHFETIPAEARDLELGHVSPNFDRAGFHADINCVYPIDRLRELAERAVIGSVANFHYAFAGNQPDSVSALRLDSGPACGQQMLEDGVDVVLLTPV